MFDIAVLLITTAVVSLLVLFHMRRDALPPKAELICDVWEWAEEDCSRTVRY